MRRHHRVGFTMLAVVALAGCAGGAEEASRQEPASGGAAPARADAALQTAGPGRPAVTEWIDPEPAGAQALAEEAVNAPWNRDKTTSLAALTTRLRMQLTTLIDSRTGITGFNTAVTAADTSLGHRLERLGAEETATEVTIRLPGSVLFDFDSAAIRPDAERALADVAAVIAGYAGRPARVEGHTDSIAAEAYNLDLSNRRAESVRGWLVGHGVDAKRLTTVGHGESNPVADNSTAAGRQRNRRVEIVIAKQG